MRTSLFTPSDVREHVRMERLVPAIERAFVAYESGDAIMPAKSYVDLPVYDGDFRAMPAYLHAGEWDAAGIKWVNVHPDNPTEHDLPTVMGTMIYSDPATGFPLAVMDGTTLTRLRTGAAAAVATDHLAEEGASSLGIIGAGAQAYTQLEAIATVRPIEEVVICDRDAERVAAFVDAWEPAYDVTEGGIAAAAGCDILSTVTPVRDPIVEADMVGPGTHVNAMGADAEGKQELDPDLLQDALVVVDDHEQATHSGEINVPWDAGTLTEADIHAELGAVVTGAAPGRTGREVTVFDSTGLAIQDVAAGHVAYEGARGRAGGTELELVGTGEE